MDRLFDAGKVMSAQTTVAPAQPAPRRVRPMPLQATVTKGLGR